MNKLIPFTLNKAEVKGRVVKLDKTLDIILKKHQYSDLVARILAELLLVGPLIGSQFKEEIFLTLQLQVKDKTQYFVADYQHPGKLRGYANCDKITENDEYESIVKNSLLLVTIDRQNNNRYQGIVEITKDSISEALENYFHQSEQIDTSIKIKVDKLQHPNQNATWCGGGMLLQALPSEGNNETWRDANIYFSTIKDDELIDPSLTLENLLYALYNEMEIRIYDPLTIEHQCHCSHSKIENVILSLGREESEKAFQDDKIIVNCEFCNKKYEFSHSDLDKIFKI